MIRAINLTKKYSTQFGPKVVLDNINLTICKGQRLGILGRNGAGKSTLIRMLSGVEQPTSGVIERGLSLSWPLAFGGGFQGSLTGIDNIRFICRVYGVAITPAIEYVDKFSELGNYLHEPVKKYSSGMRARLAFGISMAIEFDCFLIDEVVAVGDSHFQEKSRRELFEKRGDRAMIIVSHNVDFIRDHCNEAVVLDHGRVSPILPVSEAYKLYDKL